MLREQLRSVMVQAAALDGDTSHVGNDTAMGLLEDASVNARQADVAALAQRAQRFLSGEPEVGFDVDDDDGGEILAAHVTEEELNDAILAVDPLELALPDHSGAHSSAGQMSDGVAETSSAGSKRKAEVPAPSSSTAKAARKAAAPKCRNCGRSVPGNGNLVRHEKVCMAKA